MSESLRLKLTTAAVDQLLLKLLMFVKLIKGPGLILNEAAEQMDMLEEKQTRRRKIKQVNDKLKELLKIRHSLQTVLKSCKHNCHSLQTTARGFKSIISFGVKLTYVR